MSGDRSGGHGSFRLGEWRVWPDRLELQGPSDTRKLEPLTMRLLTVLAEQAPATTSRDEIVERLWGGRVVTDDAITKQASKLRAALEQGSRSGPYIETVPKSGFRLVKPVIRPAEGEWSWSRVPTRWLLILGTVVAGMLVWITVPKSQAHWEIVQEPVTSIPGTESEPALSPDGRWLAYVARARGDRDFALYVRTIGGESSRRITAPGVSAHQPSWSLDGRVAFVLRGADGCRLAIGRPNGPFRAVASCVAAHIGGLAWLDPRRLVVSDNAGAGSTFTLTAIDLLTGARKALVPPPAGDVGDLHPLLSADGKTVFFRRSKSVGPSEIYSAPVEGGLVRQVTRDNAAINGASLGPSGSLLVSSQRGGEGFSLWALDPERQEWRRLLPDGTAEITSTIDGRLALYARFDRQVSLWEAPLSGGEGHALAESTRVDWSPALSKDGRFVAFLSNRTDEWEIWLLNRISGALRRLSHFNGPEVQDLDWSPDGGTIATSVARSGLFDIDLINVEDGSIQQVAATRQDERQPFFANAGRSLWFVRRSGNGFQLRAYDLATGTESVLADGVMRGLPSVDGRYVYASRPFADGLWRVDVRSHVAEKIADWPDFGRLRNVTVTPSGIWATAAQPGGTFALMRVDPRTNRTSMVRPLPELARPSGIAVTANSVIYARLRREEADLITIRLKER